jgi:hypothetical protein
LDIGPKDVIPWDYRLAKITIYTINFFFANDEVVKAQDKEEAAYMLTETTGYEMGVTD